MKTINSTIAIFQREFRITYRNFSDILSIFLFFIMGIMIFVFSIGANNDIFNQIGIGIIWTLILLTNNLTLRKFYQDDFNDGSLIIFHLSGLSYEVIVLIKLVVNWLVVQIPFLVLIPISGFLLNIDFFNIKIIFVSFLLGSPITTCITSISGSMNLLNKKNFAIGSLIIMILSIPVIIFSVGLINTEEELIGAQINILMGIMFLFIAITPWICSICIKLAIQGR
jgi:heme exporter protein B